MIIVRIHSPTLPQARESGLRAVGFRGVQDNYSPVMIAPYSPLILVLLPSKAWQVPLSGVSGVIGARGFECLEPPGSQVPILLVRFAGLFYLNVVAP